MSVQVLLALVSLTKTFIICATVATLAQKADGIRNFKVTRHGFKLGF